MRWASSALLCLQEIPEDYLMEFFSDGYILAAHAHRVTIMPQNFDTLQRLRFHFNQLLQPVPIRDMRTMNILNIPPLYPCARQTEPTRANLNSKSTRSRVKRNSKDGQADEGHEQVRVIEEREIVMEEPIMQENEQNMEHAEHVSVSEPAPVSEPLPVSETAPVSEPLLISEPAPVSEPLPVSEHVPLIEHAPVSEPAPIGEPTSLSEHVPLSETVSEAPMLVREDIVSLMEDPVQERQGEGSASQRPSNMEPSSDEAMILAEVNEENKEDLQALIRSVPLHAKIMLPQRSKEDCILTLDRHDFLCMHSFYESNATDAVVQVTLWYFSIF
ncbi:hypothetical protein L7F22_006610 [Adiantum nelumboides]|nr:hypothetical protein [Adiantum nelumboides]